MLAKYRKNAKIRAQGEEANAVFYVQSGEVKFAVVSDQGREAVVAIVTKDQFFGEDCLAGRTKCIATATASADSVILRILRDTFLRSIKANPAFSQLFVEHLLACALRVEADLVDQ